MKPFKLEDLKCEFCNGEGEKEKFVAPYGDSPVPCSFCNASGIDEHQVILYTKEKLWDEAHLMMQNDTSKSQTEHYIDLLSSRDGI